VWMSTMPAVRYPYCAGNAPVRMLIWSAKRVSSAWPKPEIASGIWTPSMRYCRFE
jgi:hypothetical protein